MPGDDAEIEHIEYLLDADEVAHWRVVNNFALGTITHVDRDTGAAGEPFAVIQLDTADIDGTGEMSVQFGVNPGAVESFVGSLCLNMAPDEVTSREWYDKIWEILHSADE